MPNISIARLASSCVSANAIVRPTSSASATWLKPKLVDNPGMISERDHARLLRTARRKFDLAAISSSPNDMALGVPVVPDVKANLVRRAPARTAGFGGLGSLNQGSWARIIATPGIGFGCP